MKSLTYIFVLTFTLFSLSNCEIIRDVAQEELEERVNCIPPTANVYLSSYQIVADKTFESDKETAAYRETTNLECMTSEQIKGFIELFDFESTRLEYAKFAYAYCSDQHNYYSTISPLFDFESSKRELEDLVR